MICCVHIKYYLTEWISLMTQCSQSVHKQGPGVFSGNYATNIVASININTFFAQRVVKPWNSLNITLDDWSSVTKFRTLIKNTDLSDFFAFSVTFSTGYTCCFIIIIC